MIKRYSREKMASIFDLNSKFQYYLDVEIAVLKAYNKQGVVSNEALSHIEKTAKFDLDRIDEIENIVRHDVIAFLQNVNENVGEKFSPLIHMGLTSSDVIDTALALQIKDASDIIKADIELLLNTIKKMAIKHKNTVCLGRSHGIGAEALTFGFKLLNLYDMLDRANKRFLYCLKDALVGQISGPIGTYSNVDPIIEDLTCEFLNLEPAKISTQVIARDRHSALINAIAHIGAVIENFSIEIRHLQRWEVAEVFEGFKKGQKGSSAMPHKKNPISTENLSGLVRILRANSLSAQENIALWHERDISHSSVERVIVPDCFILLDYMLIRFNDVIENLVIVEENMAKNLEKYGSIIFSQSCLLELCKKMTREQAYEIVQKEALDAFHNNGNFMDNMKNHLDEEEMKKCFDIQSQLKNIDKIFERFGA